MIPNIQINTKINKYLFSILIRLKSCKVEYIIKKYIYTQLINSFLTDKLYNLFSSISLL